MNNFYILTGGPGVGKTTLLEGLAHEGYPITPEMEAVVGKYRNAKAVFLLPPWAEIYCQDEARKQSWDEAEYTFKKKQCAICR